MPHDHLALLPPACVAAARPSARLIDATGEPLCLATGAPEREATGPTTDRAAPHARALLARGLRRGHLRSGCALAAPPGFADGESRQLARTPLAGVFALIPTGPDADAAAATIAGAVERIAGREDGFVRSTMDLGASLAVLLRGQTPVGDDAAAGSLRIAGHSLWTRWLIAEVALAEARLAAAGAHARLRVEPASRCVHLRFDVGRVPGWPAPPCPTVAGRDFRLARPGGVAVDGLFTLGPAACARIAQVTGASLRSSQADGKRTTVLTLPRDSHPPQR